MSNIEIEIPTMGWEQIGGDMDPATYGGTIATADGREIELIKIQPVREYVGDAEAKDVGFPFWTRTGYYTIDDLDLESDEVKSALKSTMDLSITQIKSEFTPTTRALIIAQALFDYGHGVDEGPAGWSGDIGIPDKVKWMDGTVAGAEFLAGEDREFIREVSLADLDIDYESQGPDKKNPESGLRVATRGFTVEIAEWTDIEAATGDEQPEGEKIVRQSAEVELDDLLDPDAKHRGAYSGDSKTVTLESLIDMDDEDRQEAIVSAAIAYIAYGGGDEEYVDAIGD